MTAKMCFKKFYVCQISQNIWEKEEKLQNFNNLKSY